MHEKLVMGPRIVISVAMDISQRLRLARKKAGYVRAVHAARALDVNQQTYIGHENGSRGFRHDTAIVYARAFGVDLEWLLTGQGSPGAASSTGSSAISRSPSEGKQSMKKPSNMPPGPPADYDPDIFSQAVAMVDEFKLDMGFNYVSTPDYLQLIETFYEQVRSERARTS